MFLQSPLITTDSHKLKLMEQQAYRYIKQNLSPQSVYQLFVDYIY